jgi:hypothetical protein
MKSLPSLVERAAAWNVNLPGAELPTPAHQSSSFRNYIVAKKYASNFQRSLLLHARRTNDSNSQTQIFIPFMWPLDQLPQSCSVRSGSGTRRTSTAGNTSDCSTPCGASG